MVSWLIYYVFCRTALSSSFYVHFFLGNVPASPGSWTTASTLVASHTVMTPLFSLSPRSMSYGQIPLTQALLSSLEIDFDLTPDRVIPILKSRLRWRVQTFDHQHVDTRRVSSLKLYVAGQKVEQQAGRSPDQFPTYGPLVAYREVTRGKLGSLGDGDPL